jgi:hypothetical protein
MCNMEEGMMWESWTVNLYITELWVLFVGHKTMEVQSRARLPGNRMIEKVAKYGMGKRSVGVVI